MKDTLEIHQHNLNCMFTEFTVERWELIIMNFIQEEEDVKAFHEKRERRIFTESTICVATALGITGRDIDALSEAADFFPRQLSIAAKDKFCKALTSLAQKHYEPLDHSFLFEILDLARLFPGSLEPVLCEKIILDEKLEIGVRLAAFPHLCIERSFRTTPSDEFWETIERQLSVYPEFAPWVIMHHYKNRNAIVALEILGEFTLPEHEERRKRVLQSLEIPCREAYGKRFLFAHGGKERFMEILEKLPVWAQEFLKTSVIPNPIIR